MNRPIIGIPVYKDHECFEEMHYSLVSSTNYYDEIIIIESDGDLNYWNKFKDAQRVRVFHRDKGGPIKAYNELFKLAKEMNKDLLITQTDVVFPRLYKRDWLKIMSDIASKEDIGLVIPINGGGISGESYVNGLHWVGGWATYISKKCWEVFDKYDENYSKGYGVDIEMSYIINQKYKTFMMEYWVDHHKINEREHDKSPESEKAKQEASNYFKQKWRIK